jgi:hypothetical protein
MIQHGFQTIDQQHKGTLQQKLYFDLANFLSAETALKSGL